MRFGRKCKAEHLTNMSESGVKVPTCPTIITKVRLAYWRWLRRRGYWFNHETQTWERE